MTYSKKEKVVCPMIFIPQDQIKLAVGISLSTAKRYEARGILPPRRLLGDVKGWLRSELENITVNLPTIESDEN